MKPSEALERNLDAVSAAVRRHKAANPRVFGSVRNGRDVDGSDIDFLVDALPAATLLDLGGLQDELEALLGVKVDLLLPTEIPEPLRAKILAEAKPV